MYHCFFNTANQETIVEFMNVINHALQWKTQQPTKLKDSPSEEVILNAPPTSDASNEQADEVSFRLYAIQYVEEESHWH